LRRFLKGTVVPFDIWRVNRKELMINYLSIGLDAAIVSSFHIYRTRGKISFNSVLFNKLAYATIGISRVFCKIRGNLKLKFWSEDETRGISLKGHRLVIISNIPFYAGGTLLAPQANFSDGFLEITPFPRAIHLIGLFAFQRNLFFRKWYGNRLTHFQANRIEIDVPNGNCLQIDGEDKTFLLNSKKIEIEYGGQISLLRARQ
jgi:diacylglycerol kinase family enzyme